MNADPAPVVLLPRAAYVAMLQAARAASEDGRTFATLLRAIEVLEASRAERELDAVDEQMLASFPSTGVVGNRDGYYPVASHDAGTRERNGRPTREIWRGTLDTRLPQDIHVMAVPPLPSDRIESLVRKKYLKSLPLWFGPNPSPFQAFTKCVPWDRYAREWKSVRESTGKFGVLGSSPARTP